MNTTEWWRATKGLIFLKDGGSLAMFRVGGLIGILSRGEFRASKKAQKKRSGSIGRIRVKILKHGSNKPKQP